MIPTVSVLIVNYNVKDYLLQCLKSIEASTGDVSFEIIVVDSASVDGSQEFIRPRFPNITWIQLHENIGFGRANNRGLEVCKGKYVLFLNPDTIVAPDTLQTMVEFLDNATNVGLAGCKVLNPDGTFQLACRRGMPTPWVSFCRLSGLQSLFPNTKLFAQYNLTYKSTDETYPVDALIGAFMMGPREFVTELGGFDPAFFMYGEDLDLCYRTQLAGKQVMYVHTTSIIHFKGESTRRSSINEARIFHEAMEIFARKHFGRSAIFLWLLKTGISIRELAERIQRRGRDITSFILDGLGVLAALLISTAIRFEGPFGFPEYAYPVVLIVVPLVVLLSLLGVGEYVEYRPSIRRSSVGLLVSFFVLSSITYFVKSFAFSRGVVLMTIGLSLVFLALIRAMFALYDVAAGRNRVHRILVVGLTSEASKIIAALHSSERLKARVLGVISVGTYTQTEFASVPILGTIGVLDKVVRDVKANEIVLADPSINKADAMAIMQLCAPSKARFHIATDYADIVTARIINDVSGVEPTVERLPLDRFRNRVVKRIMDLVCAIVVLPFIGLQLSLGSKQARKSILLWLLVLKGDASVVGLYPDGKKRSSGKQGVTSLANLYGRTRLDSHAIEQLNDYYVDHFSLALDADILIKHLLGLHRGSNNSRL